MQNGDIIAGVSVISSLQLDSLARGEIHRFMFQGADMNIGQSWYVPVMVAVGARAGKRLLLNTGIHGDELNGSRVIHEVFAQINLDELSGVIIAVMQANPCALLRIQRNWLLSSDGGEVVNLNRVFPGKAMGNSAEVHAYKLWHNLYAGNCDFAVDLHTQSTDTEFRLLLYADYSVKGVREIAEAFPADHIKVDDGLEASGALENTLNAEGIPAVTLEVGGPRCYQPEFIARAVEGIFNLLRNKKMLFSGKGRSAADFGTIIGRRFTTISAQAGGYAEILVEIGTRVKAGAKLALQRNPFGDVIQEYAATHEGVVVSVASGATREAGGLLVRLLSDEIN
jgi:predicted deacylase